MMCKSSSAKKREAETQKDNSRQKVRILRRSEGRMTGVVIGKSSRKTLIVEVLKRYSHRKYGKVVFKTKRYKLHAEGDLFTYSSRGEKVLMRSSRPLSKTKRLVLL
jgi:small subunit ribosomal protein S17